MSKSLQMDYSSDHSHEAELHNIRWFLLRLFAITLVLSLPACVIIVVLTKIRFQG